MNSTLIYARKIEKIEPKLHQKATRLKVIYGPYKVRASNSKNNPGNMAPMDSGGTAYAYKAGEDFPTDITVLGSTIVLVDENFRPITLEVDGIYNHHTSWADFNRPMDIWLSCDR